MAYANETGATRIVAVTKETLGPAANGSELVNLQHKQLGLLDIDTGKFSDGTSGERFQFVYGIDTDGDGTVDKHIMSPVFKKGALRSYINTTAVIGNSDAWLLYNYKSACDKQCKITVDVKNGLLVDHFGGKLTKEYVFGPVCKEGCDTFDCNELTKAIVETINNDPEGLIKAIPVSYDSTNDVWNDITDIDAYIAANKGTNTDGDPANDVCSGVRLEAIPAKVKAFCEFNNLNYDDRQTTLAIYAGECFECNDAVIEKTTDAVQDVGNWLDVRTMETESEALLNGYDVYKKYAATGTSTRKFQFLAEEGVYYDINDLVINLREAVDGSGNWVFHFVFGVPTSADAAIKTSFDTLFNNLK